MLVLATTQETPMELQHPGLLAENRSEKKGAFKDRLILQSSLMFLF